MKSIVCLNICSQRVYAFIGIQCLHRFAQVEQCGHDLGYGRRFLRQYGLCVGDGCIQRRILRTQCDGLIDHIAQCLDSGFTSFRNTFFLQRDIQGIYDRPFHRQLDLCAIGHFICIHQYAAVIEESDLSYFCIQLFFQISYCRSSRNILQRTIFNRHFRTLLEQYSFAGENSHFCDGRIKRAIYIRDRDPDFADAFRLIEQKSKDCCSLDVLPV